MSVLPPIAEMERAYLGRDAAYDGIFFMGVRTTAIFCRPVCPARKPLPKNVEYFPTAAAALYAGYRACKRCRPLGNDAQPAWAAKLLADIQRRPAERIREGDLRRRGLVPATVRRHFQKEYGMTFQAYARARRLAGAFQSIKAGTNVDAAAADSGFASASGFRDAFARTFGSPPAGAADRECLFLEWFSSPVGPLIAGATDEGVCLLEFSDRRMLEAQFRALRERFRRPMAPGQHPHLVRLRTELDGYFAGMLRDFSVPLAFPGTPFQQRVWAELLRIPYGETRSYEDVAKALGQPKAVRAVGRANGMNRIAIVIPCHRVVNKGGGLGGYGGGLRRKEFLLALERRAAATMPR